MVAIAKIPPSVLSDISPSRGEIDKPKASRFISMASAASCEWKFVPQLISPHEGEMSGRTEGGERHLLKGQTHAR
ncbi:hypothetical protein RS75_00155 [Rhizobium nepotum 39/7]|uniref:Transposase n=1 Tax=Rhizobium nepotum 39/7 TaxID=1368418 RepID=A0ABR5CY36_9HYPH|nr:hypothetical protein RS75_00155 [Rhizobium nepotum 39/7]